MSYLDIANEIRNANKAKRAEKATSTAQTPSESLRNKSLEPVTEVATPQQGVTIPARTNDLERLPWALERLVAAASSDLLPKEPAALPDGLVYDLNRFVLAWAASYLISDRDEALHRLWDARRIWKGVN